MRWEFIVAQRDGTRLGALTGIREPQVTWRLLDAADVSFTLDGRDERAALIDELITDLLVYADGTLKFRGRIVPSGDEIDSSTHTAKFTAIDYRGLLRRRILNGTTTAVTAGYSGTDQGAIAWDIISDHQALTNGSLGITQGTGLTTGISRTRPVGYYTAGQNLGETIDKLATLNNGFDYEIDPFLKLNLWYPKRGTARDFQVRRTENGGTATKVVRTVDPSDFANVVRFSGATHVANAVAVDIATRPEGRWERQLGDTGITTQQGVDDASVRALADAQTLDASYTATIARDAGWNPDVLWLGDTCRLVVRSGRLNVNKTARLLEVSAKPDAGGELVDLVFDRPRIINRDLRRLARLASRVENLERR